MILEITKELENEIVDALKQIALQDGNPIAISTEQVFRNETRHFKSDNFHHTFGAGMEVGHDRKTNTPITTFPYGWGSLTTFWTKYPQFAPIGVYNQVENSSFMAQSRGVRTFIKFPSVRAGMEAVAERLRILGGNAGGYFANDQHPEQQKAYSDYLRKIKAKYCLQINIA